MRIGLCGALLVLLLATPSWANDDYDDDYDEVPLCALSVEIDPNYQRMVHDPVHARVQIRIHKDKDGLYLSSTVTEAIVFDTIKTAYGPMEVPAIHYRETTTFSMDGKQIYNMSMSLTPGKAVLYPFKVVSFRISGFDLDHRVMVDGGSQAMADSQGRKPSPEVLARWRDFSAGQQTGTLAFAAPTGLSETRMEGSVRVRVPIYHPAKTVQVGRRHARADYAPAAAQLEARLKAELANGDCSP